MSALAVAQRDFLAALFQADGASSAGFEVYRRTVLANLGGALSAAFPVTRRLVGDAFFDEAARRHALAQPSTSGDLGEYGARFPHFLAGYAPTRDLEYLPGVARLEWALHSSHRAADSRPFDFASLAQVPAEVQVRIRLLLQPEVRLVRSRHPVLAIWQANQLDRDGTPDVTQGAQHVLVTRVNLMAQPILIEPREWELLRAIECGLPLEEAAACFEDPGQLAPVLSRFAAAGVFSGFEPPPAA